jgi:hypothetical protein
MRRGGFFMADDFLVRRMAWFEAHQVAFGPSIVDAG